MSNNIENVILINPVLPMDPCPSNCLVIGFHNQGVNGIYPLAEGEMEAIKRILERTPQTPVNVHGTLQIPTKLRAGSWDVYAP